MAKVYQTIFLYVLMNEVAEWRSLPLDSTCPIVDMRYPSTCKVKSTNNFIV